MMSGLKRTPRKDQQETAFIEGAEHQSSSTAQVLPRPAETPATVEFPWEALSVREDVTKVYNLRLPEAYLLKLKYIAEHTPDSMQKFCLDVLLPAIDEKIEELI